MPGEPGVSGAFDQVSETSIPGSPLAQFMVRRHLRLWNYTGIALDAMWEHQSLMHSQGSRS